MAPAYEIRRVSAGETRPLRQAVLRPHQRLDEVGFAGDELAGAAHFGAFHGGEMVATATVHPEEGGWRLRGMATREDHRGRGLGGQLVQACIEWARGQRGTVMWCNARLKAVDFYRRHGFETRGAPFDLAEIGPHYYMWLAI